MRARPTELRERQIDVGFIVGADQVLGLELKPSGANSRFIALAERHTPASHDEVTLGDLLRQRIIMRTRGDGSSAPELARRAARSGWDVCRCDDLCGFEGRRYWALVGAGFGSTVAAGVGHDHLTFQALFFGGSKCRTFSFHFEWSWFAGNDNRRCAGF